MCADTALRLKGWDTRAPVPLIRRVAQHSMKPSLTGLVARKLIADGVGRSLSLTPFTNHRTCGEVAVAEVLIRAATRIVQAEVTVRIICAWRKRVLLS